MTTIHINSFLGDEDPLETDSIPEGFELCAAKFEKLAEQYREMASYFRDKKIKVLDTNGYPHCGSFDIDEIDTERLKQAGKVIDFADNPEERNPLFSIDSELDAVLDNLDHEDFVSSIVDDEDIIDSDELRTDTYDLASVILQQTQTPDFEDSATGAINLEVSKVGEGEYVFNLHIRDLGNNIPKIQFQRETGIFKYHCGSCDIAHTQTLENVQKSLITTCALMSNFAYMARNSKEFCMALSALDDDLRLLSHLISFDYALDEPPTPEK